MNEGTAHARGTCEVCGPYRVSATNVTVRQRLDDGSWSYRVRCPHCRCSIVSGVRPRVALQLLLAQAPIETWSLPSDEYEYGSGPAISIRDLASLRSDLEHADVVELLRATLDAA